jgi:hypothetical protein
MDRRHSALPGMADADAGPDEEMDDSTWSAVLIMGNDLDQLMIGMSRNPWVHGITIEAQRTCRHVYLRGYAVCGRFLKGDFVECTEKISYCRCSIGETVCLSVGLYYFAS